jgi:hypothetical protein
MVSRADCNRRAYSLLRINAASNDRGRSRDICACRTVATLGRVSKDGGMVMGPVTKSCSIKRKTRASTLTRKTIASKRVAALALARVKPDCMKWVHQ